MAVRFAVGGEHASTDQQAIGSEGLNPLVQTVHVMSKGGVVQCKACK